MKATILALFSFFTVSAFAQQGNTQGNTQNATDSVKKVTNIHNTGSNSLTMPDNPTPRKETRTNKPASNNGKMIKTGNTFSRVPNVNNHVQTENGQAVSMDTVGALRGSVVYKNKAGSSTGAKKTTGKRNHKTIHTKTTKTSSIGAANNERS